ncbi:molecular chaperone DnaJ [Niveispirillum fermenti]|uniref:molecular chaperone DnaJ n=1 Tax=Niveispirillum fermenti TaxID=1233113 RepID=UPI003A8BF6B4
MDAPLSCWHCAGNVSARALFCHGCGAIQPPGAADPFTRLGLVASFELDMAAIDRQLAGFARILAPARFAARGEAAAAHAAAHRQAQTRAAVVLRDPAARARALLDLTGDAPARPANGGPWEIALAAAPDAGARTRALEAVKTEMQGELRLLLDAFRLGDPTLAATRLARVEAMAMALDAARRAG